MESPLRFLLGFGVVVAACSGTYEGSAPPSDAGTGADVGLAASPDSGAADTGTVADSATPDAGPACDLDGAFDSIERLDDLDTSGNDVGLAITDDGLTAYVVRAEAIDGSFGRNLYVSKRTSTAGRWSTPVAVPGFYGNGGIFDNPTLPKDGRTLFVEVRGGASLDIVAVPRDPTKALDFGLARAVNGVSLAGSAEFDSYVTRDGRSLYFTSDRSGQRAIYRASLDATGNATRLDMLLGLSENGTEQDSVPNTPDDTLYFTRWLPTDSGQNPDVFVAKRPAPGADFGKAIAVAELNTPGGDYVVDISDDGCTVYYTTDGRPDSRGVDLYAAKKKAR